MPLRGLDANGSGSTSDLISAIEYANANGADVINNSWGGSSYSQATKDAIDASSAVVVCAAGNENENNDTTPSYPASYTSTNIISVAATDQYDKRASFSNYGATSVDVSAPGTNIYSTTIPRNIVFSDDFNDGNINGWTTGGTSNWGIESTYLTESPSGNYADSTDSWIRTTSAISLAGETVIRLEFQLRGISESDYDFLFIETSSNGTDPWTPQDQLSGSTSGNWYSMEYDINTYAGNQVYIRFSFTSDGSNTFDGWHIDDIKITSYSDTPYNSYKYLDGTSMATPIVSGIAGLVKSRYPGATNIEIKSAIENSIDTISALSGVVATGGRVNANKIFLPATAPSGLTASDISSSRIDLTWNDNSSNEMEFIIERKTGAAGTYAQIHTAAANATSYSNTGLSASTNYLYRLYAHNSTGDSAYTNEADATTPAAPPSGGGGGGGCFIDAAGFGL